MPELHKQALAEQDLIDIWLYSFERWGVAQADTCLDHLEEGLALLANNPRIGAPSDHLRPGYRRFHIKQHLVYYRVAGDRIDIVRILHEDMDPDGHL